RHCRCSSALLFLLPYLLRRALSETRNLWEAATLVAGERGPDAGGGAGRTGDVDVDEAPGRNGDGGERGADAGGWSAGERRVRHGAGGRAQTEGDGDVAALVGLDVELGRGAGLGDPGEDRVALGGGGVGRIQSVV